MTQLWNYPPHTDTFGDVPSQEEDYTDQQASDFDPDDPEDVPATQ
jgi:hypothetical protein